MKRKTLIAVFCSALLLTGCADTAKTDSGSASSAAETTAPQPVEHALVTLGDSIAFGYGMEDPDNQRYSAIIAKKLAERDDADWHDYNYALSGDDSSDLLWRLEKGRAMRLPSADTIIINIGSNNLLRVYSDYVKDVTDIDTDMDIESITDEQIEAMQTKIEDAFQDEEAVRKELQSRIDTNLQQLETDLDAIYNWIRERNPDGQVYVLNIYNPYRGMESAGLPGETEAFGDYAQEQIDRANAILSAFTDAHSDLIPVDVAEAFANCDPVPIIGKTELPEDVSLPDGSDAASQFDEAEFVDPHPNEAGQQLIADTIWAEMETHA